jgi:hypothetical protein
MSELGRQAENPVRAVFGLAAGIRAADGVLPRNAREPTDDVRGERTKTVLSGAFSDSSGWIRTTGLAIMSGAL